MAIFFKGVNPWFWSKTAFFGGAIEARKMSFSILQNEKTPVQTIKRKSLKSPKIDIFAKGLTHGFGPKRAIFPTFFLGNIGQGNVFYDILERKNAFLGYKNNKFKKSKNGHFSDCFFQSIQAKKMSFTIFQNEKTPFQAIKTTSSKSR